MVEKGSHDDVPPWLRPLLKTSFFVPCHVHGVSNKIECNMYCLQCMGSALCSSCLPHHKDHHVVQVRRSTYHDVVKVSEVSKFIDLSSVQTYVINGAKVVFLKERPLSRPWRKGGSNACEMCGRGLVDSSSRFCSLECKLGGMKSGPELASAIGPTAPDHDSLSGSIDSDGETRARKQRTSTTDFRQEDPHASSRNDVVDGEKTSTRPTKSRRKGVPRRSPFF